MMSNSDNESLSSRQSGSEVAAAGGFSSHGSRERRMLGLPSEEWWWGRGRGRGRSGGGQRGVRVWVRRGKGRS
ncbi:hypothetical protein E2C01_034819 [Portunus trituberculatus]|uniref:Uncharacterized protein n=1 Tax=Portunus trituberculatus TaxID=210409 RepID=A0A5B7F3U7_PORTR|nr:hypothetical protein [Portunus trituberculatus]